MNQFDQETNFCLDADSRLTGTVHPHWNIGTNPNGGYLMALAASGMRQRCPKHPDPLSLTAHYQRPGLGAHSCTLDAELLREGASISTVRASLMQEGKQRLELLGSFGLLPSHSEPAQVSVAPPPMPEPDECIRRSGEAQGVDLPIMQRLDIRLHPDNVVKVPNGVSQVRGWARFKDGREPDSLALLLFADAFPPAIFGLLGMVGWVPTIELTVHVRRRPAPGWIQAQFRTQDLCDGRMIEEGLLWDSEGHLVAQCRQLAMLLKKP
jgi:acyl-CoA thioesterase